MGVDVAALRGDLGVQLCEPGIVIIVSIAIHALTHGGRKLAKRSSCTANGKLIASNKYESEPRSLHHT